VLKRLRLVECPGPNIRRRILAFVLVTWGPLLALSLVQGMAFGNQVRIPFLDDWWMYWRTFAAIPLLLVAEIVIDPWIRQVVRTFDSSGIVREHDLPAYYAILERIARWRDSGPAEFALALLSSFPFFLFADYEWVSSGISTWHGSTSGGLTPAGWWFASVSSPLLRFLILRWLWRYILWSFLLLRVAKLNLKMIPTHPDGMGGLGFVPYAQRQFGILFTATGSLIAGQYANSIAYFGTPLAATEAPTVVFIVFSILVVAGPLTVLSPRLLETQRRGLARYNQAARRLAGSFDSKWATGADEARGSMLGSQDPSSLIDYVSVYNVIRDMKIIPINKRLVIQVAAQAAAPLALVWFFATPVDQIVKTLLKMLF
jgi:hypothetical protein